MSYEDDDYQYEIEHEMAKAKIAALEAAEKNLGYQLEDARRENEQEVPWRREKPHVNKEEIIKRAIHDVQNEIIGLERSLRDPEQDAEIRHEMMAEMAMNGCRDPWGESRLYMHTAKEEELFQAGIWAQVEAEHREEMGYYDEYGKCPCCGTMTDEWMEIDGADCCTNCCEEVIYWLAFLSGVSHTTMVVCGRWKDQYQLISYEQYLEYVEEGTWDSYYSSAA